MKCEYSAFQGDTLDLAWGVFAPEDSSKEPTTAPIQEWVGFLMMLQTTVKIMTWLQWPQFPSKDIAKGKLGYGTVDLDKSSFLTLMTAKCEKLRVSVQPGVDRWQRQRRALWQ